MTTTPPSPQQQPHNNKIRVLPHHVVDRIKAGEVIQRAASAIKELLENSLDAGSTDITVTVNNKHHKLVVSDNGCGMDPADLRWAVVRHATSKLQTTDDLKNLRTFGFRGEALASVAAVSHLQICSRTAQQATAFVYNNNNNSSADTSCRPGEEDSNAKLMPCARPVGTTVTVQKLFALQRYHAPRRNNNNSSRDYDAIVTLMQQYAIQHAGEVGICCQQVGKRDRVDLNTRATVRTFTKAGSSSSSLTDNAERREEATKQVIAQIYGTQVASSLLRFESKLEDDDDDKDATVIGTASDAEDSLAKESKSEEERLVNSTPSYSCQGFVTSPSYNGENNKNTTNRNTFILFINQRLVECPSLKRRLQDVYLPTLRSFMYLSITVPPHHVDANVHPTKQYVTLLHLDAIVQHIADTLRSLLQRQGRSFVTQPVSQTTLLPKNSQKDNGKPSKPSVQNPYKRSLDEPKALSSQTKRTVAPSKKIRTSQRGAMEPFLSSSQAQSSTQTTPTQHESDCPLASKSSSSSPDDVDLSQPGAFATVAARCTCRRSNSLEVAPIIRLPRQALTRRPKKITPTACSYTSIAQLRKYLQKNANAQLQSQLQSACWVGVVSHHRSLLQCRDCLVLWNHYECAQELFYQLALNHFGGGSSTAQLGAAGVHVAAVIGAFLQLEQDLAHHQHATTTTTRTTVSETNQALAQQAAACLWDHADMLREYFSIELSMQDDDDEDQNRVVLLKGLPVLLDGYEPLPHGLPLFLLRLATEVDWTEEKPCFDGICRELGAYYAQLPHDERELGPFIRHVLFPAISTLLVPVERMPEDCFVTLTDLKKLYKVFERC